MYNIILSANNDSFSYSFPIWMPFTSSCLIAVVKTSSTMLRKISKSGHSYLVPDLRGNNFNFYPLNMIMAIGLSCMTFIMLRYVPCIPTLLRVFIINRCWILSNAFSATIDMIMGFLFILFMWYNIFIDLQILYQHCIS